MPELRKDPVVGRWVIISTERGKRPSDFVIESEERRGGFCPFCAGNESKTPPEVLAYRQNGTDPNQPGWNVRIVPNKYPALQIEGNLDSHGDGVYDFMNGVGAHEVVIETPDHDKDLVDLDVSHLEDIWWAIRERILDLRQDVRFKYILVFKNHGASAGASLEHSHSQLIATPIVPVQVMEELDGYHQYFAYKERCIFCDIIRQERETGKRIVLENDRFISIEPFAPRFPITFFLPVFFVLPWRMNDTRLVTAVHRSAPATEPHGQKPSLSHHFSKAVPVFPLLFSAFPRAQWFRRTYIAKTLPSPS